MILIPNKEIMLVHDFGEDAGGDTLAMLKAAIESNGDYTVNVVDLRAVVSAEHPDEELTEARMIELGARRLETEHPDTVVVFGKSAMLAGGLGERNVLFINAEYDWEWPWKKQYYADERLAYQYHRDMDDYDRDQMTTVTWSGTEIKRTKRNARRYGVFTRPAGYSEFWDRYPRMAEMAEQLEGDTKGLADFICRFTDGDITIPLEEVYSALSRFPRGNEPDYKWICRFSEPVKIGGSTILGIQFGSPMANGQSCYKLKVEGIKYPIPLERFDTRREYNLLRDAILNTREKLKEFEKRQRRILIVPDYFTPFDVPYVKELYRMLTDMDYQVAVLMPDSSLAKARQALERRCKSKPFDLIVTIDTGCLLAARVTNCQRIFVNPDWTAWEWMTRSLGENRQKYETRGAGKSGPVYTYLLNAEEIGMAREMAERSNIRRGKYPAAGWFTEDAVDSHLTTEHLKRLNTSTFIPSLRLDTDKGIAVLADQIHNIFSVDDE